MPITDVQRSLDNLKLERDAIVLYDTLATIEKDPRRAQAFQTIASNERRHAEIWANRLREEGASVPPPGPPRLRVRFIMLLARRFGTRAVSDLVKALEGDEEEAYAGQTSPDVAAIAADEKEHAEIWRRLDANAPVPIPSVEGNGTAHAAASSAGVNPSGGAFAGSGVAVGSAGVGTAIAAGSGRATTSATSASV